MSKDARTQISLRASFFPNTGHHLMFVRLSRIDDSATSVSRGADLPQFDQAELSALLAITQDPATRDGCQPWEAHSEHPWIKYRLGVATYYEQLGGNNIPIQFFGLWIAVETNLGTCSRGYETRVSSPPNLQEIEKYVPENVKQAKQNATRDQAQPYYASELGTFDWRPRVIRVPLGACPCKTDQLVFIGVQGFGGQSRSV